MRRIREILAVGLTVGVVVVLIAALFFLVPAHLQIRKMGGPLPSTEDLEALLEVPDGPVSISWINTATQSAGGRTLGHDAVWIRWADGRGFLVDTSMDEAAAADFRDLMALLWGEGEYHWAGDGAALLGPDVAHVAGVGFTHLHIDHTQGLGSLCRALEREGVPHARLFQTREQATVHNLHTSEGAAIVAGSCLQLGALGDGVLHAVDGFPGLAMVALGGHTPGSTLFAVAVQGHLWLLSGDTTNEKSAITHDRGKGFFYSYILVPEDTARTAELRGWLRTLDAREDTTVIVSHDVLDMRASAMPEYRRP